MSRESERNRGDAKSGNRPVKNVPGPPDRWQVCQQQRHDHGTGGRTGTQPSKDFFRFKSKGAGINNIAGEDGQQIDRATQQHGKEIKRNCAKQHLTPPHKPQPFSHLTDHVSAMAPRCLG